MGGRYWFRPKSAGYGVVPVTWEGWAFTLGSMIVSVSSIVTVVVAELQRWPGRRGPQVACLALLAVTLVATSLISRRKTDGDRRWRRD